MRLSSKKSKIGPVDPEIWAKRWSKKCQIEVPELPSRFLGPVLDLRHKKGIDRLVLEIGPFFVGATSYQLLTTGFSLLPPGF